MSKKSKKQKGRVSTRDRLASSAISSASCRLKNAGYNVTGVKHKQLIRMYAEWKGLTIPEGINLKNWIVSILNRTKTLGKRKKKEISISQQFSEDLQKRATKSERYFKKLLKACNIKFVFQKVIQNDKSFYIIDFYIPDKGLCIELDGEYHNNPEQKQKDSQRDTYLISQGYCNWRITNDEALAMSVDQIADKIQTFPDRKRNIRVLATAEERPVYYKPVRKKPGIRNVRVQRRSPVNLTQQYLVDVAANKARRDAAKIQKLTTKNEP